MLIPLEKIAQYKVALIPITSELDFWCIRIEKCDQHTKAKIYSN